MKRFVFLLMLAVTAGVNAGPPEVDRDEVLRRGDMVTKAGDGLFRGGNDAVNDALAIPADDSDKWFITLITSPGCQPCERLRADWQTKPELMAFANPHDAKKSWAHFNIYSLQDKTQEWRFKNITVKGTPTVLIQPPRNGQFGDPTVTVWQFSGYDGDSKKLATAMRDKIVAYAKRVSAWRPMNGRPAEDDGVPTGGFGGTVQAPFYSGPCPGPYCPNQPTVYPTYPNTAPVIPFPFDTPSTPSVNAATLDQLKQAIPAATDAFLLDQLNKKATLEDALKAWVAKGGPAAVNAGAAKFTDLQKALPTAPTTFLLQQVAAGATVEQATMAWHAANPSTPEPVAAGGLLSGLTSLILPMLGISGAAGIGVLALTWWRKVWVGSGHQPILNDPSFQLLLEFVKSLNQNQTKPTESTNPTAT